MRKIQMTRRGLLQHGAMLGLVVTSSAAGAQRATAQSKYKVTVLRPSAKSFLWAPEDYAREKGFFEKFGVTVESIASNRGVNVTGVINGEIDVGLGDPTETMNVRRQGQKVKIFGLMHNRYTSHILVKQDILKKAGITENSPEIDRAKLLKGLRMGHSGVGSGPEMLIRYCATLGGVDPNTELELVSINGAGPGMLAGIEKGLIDGFSWGAPFANVGIAKYGCGYLFQNLRNPPALFSDLKSTAMQSSERTLKEKRDALVAYTAGLAASFSSIQADPEAYKSWLRGFLEIDPEIFDAAFADSFGMYTKDPRPVVEAFPKFVKFLDVVNATRGLPPIAPIPYDELVDATLAEDAMKLL